MFCQMCSVKHNRTGHHRTAEERTRVEDGRIEKGRERGMEGIARGEKEKRNGVSHRKEGGVGGISVRLETCWRHLSEVMALSVMPLSPTVRQWRRDNSTGHFIITIQHS